MNIDTALLSSAASARITTALLKLTKQSWKCHPMSLKQAAKTDFLLSKYGVEWKSLSNNKHDAFLGEDTDIPVC